MKFNKGLLNLVSLTPILLSISVQAFSVDKMIIVSDDKGNGIVTLTNDEPQPIFVQAKIDEINIVDGKKVEKKEYTRDNLDDWKVSLTHQKLVLKPGEEKDVGIRSLCHNATCDNSKDLMLLLSFSPSKYRPGEVASGVEINYGFAPVYIIPTTQPHYAYELTNNGDSLKVENRSNTMINLFVDACDVGNKIQCKQKFTVVSGRNKTFPLNETMQNNELIITVTSHDRSYSRKETVTRGRI
ncbi:hypothetical protein BCU33_013095 [Vibrio lentus]|uniref:hypothetical protein n=1 Tax=Vibrio lentus TaxID=136468 RepID=UPI000C84D677|nr:hypothetical protein [Vibrio lentus]MCC4784508.1 hypothetical protein [Vibrio lentus]PMI92259.1 hypothetical protein BCU33_09680 [Vibrio lentus]PMJ06109.1 hypothetical protein BCU31_03350 [Vibrio lentus]TKG19617.1 hypothetical protein FCW05_09025 [Vibrio lentus]